jgi:hypothetical protein
VKQSEGARNSGRIAVTTKFSLPGECFPGRGLRGGS